MAASRGAQSKTKVVPAPVRLCYGRKISVHFGVRKYKHWDELPNGASDASALAERFENALHFDEAHVFLDGEVTQARIKQVFRDLIDCGVRDLIVITWSGHGIPLTLADGKRQKGFLVPVDAPHPIDLKNASQFCVGMEEIAKIAADYIKSRHMVFLLDCCFSGFITVQRGGDDMSMSTTYSDPCSRRRASTPSFTRSFSLLHVFE